MHVEQYSLMTMWKPYEEEKQKLNVWTVTELNSTEVFTWFCNNFLCVEITGEFEG